MSRTAWGSSPEEDALQGRFRLAENERVPDREQERLLLIATVEELLRHEIALKEVTDRGVDLVFPSQFTRERPEAPDIPGKQLTLAFEGPLHSIYATLAVRLSHSTLFTRARRCGRTPPLIPPPTAALRDPPARARGGPGRAGALLRRRAGPVVRAQFETYVAEHLQLRAISGNAYPAGRIRTCPGCGYVLPGDLVRQTARAGLDHDPLPRLRRERHLLGG